MAIDVTTPEDRERESRNISLIRVRKSLATALWEMNYLISSTPTGDRRNTLTDINIHLMSAAGYLDPLKSEEKQ